MSYEAIGSGSISLNTMTAMEQKNLQAALLERYEKLRMADVAHCGDAMVCQIEREYQERRQTMLKYNDPFWWLTVVFKRSVSPRWSETRMMGPCLLNCRIVTTTTRI